LPDADPETAIFSGDASDLPVLVIVLRRRGSKGMVLDTTLSRVSRAATCFAAGAIACAVMCTTVSAEETALSPSGTSATAEAAPATKPTASSRTRFLIGLDKSVAYTVSALPNPNRVVIDIPDVAVRLPPDPGPNPVGLVKSVRSGQTASGQTKVVIEVTEPVVIDKTKIEKVEGGKGVHLSVDIIPARKPLKSQPFALGAAGIQPPLPMPAKRPGEAAKAAYKPIIVIDPGHGGHDTGAMKHGAIEKDVVLAFAKVLRDKIEKTGRYKVLMTRDTDVFVELDERRAFGEKHQAALFIAVHADYAKTSARGATIYSLRESVANSLKRSAKGDVSEHLLSDSELAAVKKANGDNNVSAVRNILADFAGREVESTRERTNIFSRSVIEHMGETTSLRQKPDQQAAFRVLKTAQFPSVLIELAYVTNKEDARLLQSNEWRGKVADSITTAVENYFTHQLARLPM
jgi:N-acetylmuramoyl-L-alanine amidase